jgi:hypothetical protein
MIDNPALIFKPTQEVLEAPMEDNFITHTAAIEHKPAADLQVVADDVELAPLFEQLCKSLGKENTPKVRLLTARKFENDADPKATLKSYLLEKTTVVAKPPAATAAAAQPPVSSGGLI